MTETELQEIEKRCEAATPGPWSDGVAGHTGVVHFNGDDVVYVASAKPHDRVFIIGARTDIPALLSTVRELQRQVQERDDEILDEQRRTIQVLLEGVPEHIRKEGTTPVLRYICELERQVQEREAEARRYRWIRDAFPTCNLTMTDYNDKVRWVFGTPMLDDAIDNAMTEDKPHER